MHNLTDVQSQADVRGVALDRVGISGVRYPISVVGPHAADCKPGDRGALQSTVATLSMSVNLPREARGTHMSRFIELLHDHAGALTFDSLADLLHQMTDRLHANVADVTARFPLFVLRAAPVTGGEAYVDVDCAMHGRVAGDEFELTLEVRVPATSLCPCSKEISDYGAHNQRGFITIQMTQRDPLAVDAVDFGELIAMAESAASCRIHALLKRPDERAVTMSAYEKPAFVEDMARDCAARLQADPRTMSFKIHVENEESIHTHNAFAALEWVRTPVQNGATAEAGSLASASVNGLREPDEQPAAEGV